jgi:hypothetical protein
MGERLVYILPLVLLWRWPCFRLGCAEDGKHKRQILLASALCLLLTFPCAAIVIPRNAQWKDDTSLFLADVKTVPDSVIANGNAARAYLEMSGRPENKAVAIELTKKSIPFLTKAITIHKRYLNGYLDLGRV